MENKKLILSTLPKTWIFDFDGTIVKHNGYKSDGYDSILNGVKEFFEKISENDFIIILTAREEKYKEITENFLIKNRIRYNQIIFNIPVGERILINDKKNSGLNTAFAINTARDVFLDTEFIIDERL